MIYATLAIIAGGCGAAARLWADWLLQQLLPWTGVGIAAVNVLGSAILGAALGAWPPGDPKLLVLGAGWCGGFTTFSTAMVHIVTVWGRPHRRGAIALAALTPLACWAAAVAAATLTT